MDAYFIHLCWVTRKRDRAISEKWDWPTNLYGVRWIRHWTAMTYVRNQKTYTESDYHPICRMDWEWSDRYCGLRRAAVVLETMSKQITVSRLAKQMVIEFQPEETRINWLIITNRQKSPIDRQEPILIMLARLSGIGRKFRPDDRRKPLEFGIATTSLNETV